MRDFMSCDVAISIGGEMINDSFRKTLQYYLFMFWFARKNGAKRLFSSSIGPLRRSWTRWLTHKVLKGSGHSVATTIRLSRSFMDWVFLAPWLWQAMLSGTAMG